MKNPLTGKPKGNLDRSLIWILVLFLFTSFILVGSVSAPLRWLDLIYSPLLALPRDAIACTHLQIIRDHALDCENSSSPTSLQFQLNYSSINTSLRLSTNKGTSTPDGNLNSNSNYLTNNEEQNWVIWLPLILNHLSPEYYVSLDGDDSNQGTERQPWRTIQKAANTVTAGDSVVVLPGMYDERVQITSSGLSGAPITFQAEGTVTMKGFRITADHIIIQGFDITNTDNSWGEGWGILVEGSDCVLENNYVYFATRGGILLYAYGGNDPVTSNCLVKNNRLYRNATVGIEVHGRNNLIVGNEIWRTIQYHPKWTDPPSWVDANGIVFLGSGHTIRKNYIHDITHDDPENVDPHIDCFQTWGSGAGQYVIFEQNICEVLENQDNKNGHGFMLEDARNIIIRNNIIKAYGGINTGGGGNSHLTIANNIFVNDLSFHPDPGGVGLGDCPYTVVKNNIFYDQPGQTISAIGNRIGQEIDYNLAFRSDGQSSWCYAIDYECVDPAPGHHLWDVDPMFINPASGDFRLQGGSPAIDAGITLAEVLNDFDGISRPHGSGYDIGAYEYPE